MPPFITIIGTTCVSGLRFVRLLICGICVHRFVYAPEQQRAIDTKEDVDRDDDIVKRWPLLYFEATGRSHFIVHLRQQKTVRYPYGKIADEHGDRDTVEHNDGPAVNIRLSVAGRILDVPVEYSLKESLDDEQDFCHVKDGDPTGTVAPVNRERQNSFQ